ASGKFPLIVYIHGGELIEGDKRFGPNSEPFSFRESFNGAGYAFVSINYRLGPTFRFPAMIEDAKCSIRFLRATAATTFIDPDRIGVIGTSSGAYLATLVGLTDASAGFDGTGGYAGVSSRVRAV